MTGEPFRTPEDGLVVLVGGTEAITVPSGQDVTLQDVIWSEAGPAGLALRFRFVAPRIARMGGDIAFEVASEDMMALCESYALPRTIRLVDRMPLKDNGKYDRMEILQFLQQ